MKKKYLRANTTHESSYAKKIQPKETLLEKFTYWFRNFLESAE